MTKFLHTIMLLNLYSQIILRHKIEKTVLLHWFNNSNRFFVSNIKSHTSDGRIRANMSKL